LQFPVFFLFSGLFSSFVYSLIFALAGPYLILIFALSNHILFILNNLVLRVFGRSGKLFSGIYRQKDIIEQSPSRTFYLTSPGTFWTESPCQRVLAEDFDQVADPKQGVGMRPPLQSSIQNREATNQNDSNHIPPSL